MQSSPTAASGPSLALTAWVTMLAPLVAVLIKAASGGWLLVMVVWSSPLWLAGYVLLVVAAARGMLRQQGVLREGARRTRATLWAWLTSVGVLLFAFSVVDGGDTRESIQSTLTLALGAPISPSAAHEVSAGIAYVAVVAWAGGWVALLVEWAVGVQRRRPVVPRVAPPTT
ncbi:hypothetical protein [Agrococcus sp. ProA11]|uniref:hypothetical protein n=1 Tax=Agrococcus chionoecetis TaxID=3153752 RepID=UPI003260AB3C